MTDGFDAGEVSVPTQKVSRFNSAELINLRMHNLWTIFHRSVLDGKLIEANWALDRIWGELSGDISKENKEEFEKFVRRFFNIIKEKKENPNSLNEKLYLYILDKETFLRSLQNKQGKGTAYEETLEEYMDDF